MSADVLPQPEPDPKNVPTPGPQTVPAPRGDVKELRLGLVCYGGVSLAIYMHGMTKEIHRAIRASVLEERELDSAEGAASERAYRQLLQALARERGVHTRIVVDAIAGTSAGGINGIFLAKALAHDLNQDGLRDLWFEHGDFEKIIRAPAGLRERVAGRLVKFLRLGGRDHVPSEEAREKLLVAALRIHDEPLLEGNQMALRIHEALEGMEAGDAAPTAPLDSLMPPRHLLELTVTVTDHYGYARHLPIADPPVVAEAQHRHLLEFRYQSGTRNDFSRKENGALTLAARATSSLPVVFAPVHVGGFAEVLPAGATTTEAIERFFRAYRLADADPAWAYLVDGGVLDNRPFGPVLRAIKGRHAANEVDRYLLYLEPDPQAPAEPAAEPRGPRPIPAILGAVAGLPRAEPILDELHDLLVRNEHVRAVRDTIEENWGPVERWVSELVPDLDEPPADPGAPQLKQWSEGIHEAAKSLGTLGHPMYVRLKVSSAVDAFASAACLVCDYTDESNHAFLVRAILREWARTEGLFERTDGPTPTQLQFVRDFDLGYARRRLQFVIAGVNWLYRDVGTAGHPSRQELDALKERLYEAVARLEWVSSGRGFAGEVLGGVQTCLGEQRLRECLGLHGFDTDAFLADHRQEVSDLNDALRTFLATELQGFAAELYRDLVALTAGWTQTEQTRKIRRDLLIRYLGFPIWDAMLYPLEAVSDVAEGDTVRVVRLSPSDSTLLTATRPDGKLLGRGLGHAYAFFSRTARENDYLWGRLDAAERVVRLLLSDRAVEHGHERTVPGDAHPGYRRWCKEVFLAVLAEDAEHLPAIRDDVEALRAQIDAL
jgi:patatin-related protein